MNTDEHSAILLSCPEDIAAQALETFENAKGAAEWLTTPAFGLQGRVPLELVATPEGRAEVKKLLQRIDYGVP